MSWVPCTYTYNKRLSLDFQEEYLDALNQQEIAKKELDRAIQEQETMAAEVNSAKGEAQNVEQIYKEQDELLGIASLSDTPSIFKEKNLHFYNTRLLKTNFSCREFAQSQIRPKCGQLPLPPRVLRVEFVPKTNIVFVRVQSTTPNILDKPCMRSCYWFLCSWHLQREVRQRNGVHTGVATRFSAGPEAAHRRREVQVDERARPAAVRRQPARLLCAPLGRGHQSQNRVRYFHCVVRMMNNGDPYMALKRAQCMCTIHVL